MSRDLLLTNGECCVAQFREMYNDIEIKRVKIISDNGETNYGSERIQTNS